MERPASDEPASGQGLVVLGCDDLDAMLEFFVGRLGFVLVRISPADAPAVADIEGHGLRLRLDSGRPPQPLTIELVSADVMDRGSGDVGTGTLRAPDGSTVTLVPADRPLVIPDNRPELVISRLADAEGFGTGRAGMGYRDLLPDRAGGRFIASHILIPEGGPVSDYDHFHRIRFQMIHCVRGWVRLVYEDQGPPFVMEAGDCLVQPPEIRHRVLEASPGLEVVEIACPAEHDTFADHSIELPNATIDHDRTYGGQRFVWHRAADAEWKPWRAAGFVCRTTGLADATGDLAGVRVVRPVSAGPSHETESGGPMMGHDGEFSFGFVLDGRVDLAIEDERGVPRVETLVRGDAFTVPRGLGHRLESPSADLELLDVTLPAQPLFSPA